MRRYRCYRLFSKGDYISKEKERCYPDLSPRTYTVTAQIKLELLPIYQQAARAAHGQAAKLADAGGEYLSADDPTGIGRRIIVNEGYVGIKISFQEPEMFDQFWSEEERLQQEQTTI